MKQILEQNHKLKTFLRVVFFFAQESVILFGCKHVLIRYSSLWSLCCETL